MPQVSFNPFQQQQQQMGLVVGHSMSTLPYQYPQSQVQPLGQYSVGAGAGGVRSKGQDVISLVQSLMVEHDNAVAILNQQHQHQLMQMQSQMNQQASLSQQQNAFGSAPSSKEATSTSKWEEKVESLQARAEKLMDEKNALLVKQGEVLQAANESQSKISQAQSQIETLQKEKTALESDMERLKQENADLTTKVAAQSGQAVDATLNEAKMKELLKDLESLQKEVAMKEATISAQESSHAEAVRLLQKESEMSQNTLQSQIADLTVQLEQVLLAREKLHDLLLPNDTGGGSSTDKEDRMLVVIQNLQAAQRQQEAEAKESTNQISSKLDQVKVDYENQLSTLRKQLSEQKEANSALEEDVKSLLEELDQLRTAAAVTSAASNKGGDSVSEEALKGLMQAVFVNTVEHFSADDGADKSYTLPQLQKGLRAVLKGITTDRLSSSS